MKIVSLSLIAVLGLAACSQSGPPSSIPSQTGANAVNSGFSAKSPDNPTGAAAYQSPDLPKSMRPIGGI